MNMNMKEEDKSRQTKQAKQNKTDFISLNQFGNSSKLLNNSLIRALQKRRRRIVADNHNSYLYYMNLSSLLTVG